MTIPSPLAGGSRKAAAALLLCALLVPGQPAFAARSAAPAVLFDYEDGTKTSGYGIEPNACCPHSIGVSTMGRTGDYSIRSHLKYGDPAVAGGARAESHTLGLEKSYYRSGDTVYYGFSIYIMSTWKTDSREDILFQWKPWRDTCESNKFPSAFLTVQPSGKWRLRVNSDGNRCSTAGSVRKTSFDLADIRPGSWHDFVFKFRWSHRGDGSIDVWHQTHKAPGWKKVLATTGANTFNDDATTKGYLKWGIYKPAWNTAPTEVDSRVVVHDNIAVGTSFSAVDPSAH
ncbi:hypothetical protein FH608_004340 [Nonomuraea phyllanthi]|uniref:Uncharacterized protein n=1 Tax=Nonomuraea phyllanthi TaxID=2219224 RepID=A0A5C4WVY0_9ACTN|nr:polysaccharide lyase [Nonomuraea phyllanthi]KAB8197758.1 hypothetical protein FH608_004340 [Nonomuraea phyllanthi]